MSISQLAIPPLKEQRPKTKDQSLSDKHSPKQCKAQEHPGVGVGLTEQILLVQIQSPEQLFSLVQVAPGRISPGVCEVDGGWLDTEAVVGPGAGGWGGGDGDGEGC